MKYSLERKNCWKLTLAYFVIFSSWTFWETLYNFNMDKVFSSFFLFFILRYILLKSIHRILLTIEIPYIALYKLPHIVSFHIPLPLNIIIAWKTKRISQKYNIWMAKQKKLYTRSILFLKPKQNIYETYSSKFSLKYLVKFRLFI